MGRARKMSRFFRFRGISGSTGCRCRKFMRRIWIRAPIWKRISATPRCLISLQESQRGNHRSGSHRSLPESRGGIAAVSGGSRARPGLQRVLSAREFRPAIDCLGSELFQILFSAAGGDSVQRTGAGGRFWAADGFSADARPAIIFFIAIFSRGTSCCATGSPILSIIRADARARCNMTLLRCSTMPRPICRRKCASSYLNVYLDTLESFVDLDREPFCDHYYALRLCADSAGAGRLRISRILRTQGALSAKRAVCAEEPALAAAQCETAD